MDCMITEKTVKNRIGRRNKEIHKGDCGRILIAAGSWGMAGAAILAARSALRAGAGLVRLAIPEALFPIVQVGVPEATCIERNLSNLDLAAYDAICAGPGLGEGEESIALITKLLEEYEKTLVIDADGLNVIAHQDLFPLLLRRQERFPMRTILTPHMGEAKRLLGDAWTDTFAKEKSCEQENANTSTSQPIQAGRGMASGKQPGAAVSDAEVQQSASCVEQTAGQAIAEVSLPQRRTEATVKQTAADDLPQRGCLSPGSQEAAAAHVQQEGALASTDRKDASALQDLNDGAVRLRIVDALAAKTGAIVVLKGAGTLVAAPGIQAYTNTTGNPGMATGGSGDVLSGIITGLAGQRQQTAAHVQNSESADTKGCANAACSNTSPNTDVTAEVQSAQGLSRISAWDAAICGVYIHGLAGDLAAQELGEYGVTAKDLAQYTAYALKRICGA